MLKSALPILLSIVLSTTLSACGRLADVEAGETNLRSIPLELTTHLGDQQAFSAGDEIQFLLSLGSDAYIYLYYVDAENHITQVLPSKNQPSNFYSAGYFLTIPEYENNYRFTISQPFGHESIWVFASDQLIPSVQSSDDIDDYRSQIKHQAKHAYGEYELKIITKNK